MAAKTGSYQGNWKIKKINSKTGPHNGTKLSNAIRSTKNVSGEAVHLFKRERRAFRPKPTDPDGEGWMPGVSYKVQVMHRPRINWMRLVVWKAGKQILDTDSIYDDDVGGPAYKGGRIGVYCDSQALITWSALSYK